MAINVYTPGCHLLCHDDVIGSRRVSYILYLTDPDIPWKAEWGGALRLYPTVELTSGDGNVHKIPSPDPEVSIPPAFNQLSFFAVQPGESFHDVEEVYACQGQNDAKDEVRVRMAISGWYHHPQEGEEGFVEGLEETLADKSSLRQLEGNADEFDIPKSKFEPPIVGNASFTSEADQKTPGLSAQEDVLLSEDDLNFLIKYISPTYLTPDTLESVSKVFTDQWSLTLDTFLTDKFSQSLRDFISLQESQALPVESSDIEKATPWTVARPPHKHRFLYQQIREPRPTDPKSQSPLQDLLENLLPSLQFYKWLQLATGQTVSSHNLTARRFRRGKDYTLAAGYQEEDSRLEITLAITPTSGWETGAEVEDDLDGNVVAGDTAEDSAVSKQVDEEHVGKPEETTGEVDNPLASRDVGEAEVEAKKSDVGEDVGEKEEESVEPGNIVTNADVEEVKVAPANTTPLVGQSDETPTDAEVGKQASNSDVGQAENAPAELSRSPTAGNAVKPEEVAVDVEDGKLVAKGDVDEKGEHPGDVEERVGDDDGGKIGKASEEGNESQVFNDHDSGVGDIDEAARETAKIQDPVASDGVGEGDDPSEKVRDDAPGGDVGGYLAYMAGDDDAEYGNPDDKASDHGLDLPSNMSTGARSSGFSNPKSHKPDPAVYQNAGQGDEEDDGVLFSMPAGWNKLGIVLRDKGALRFVKYVSQQAKGDRWDICGEFTVENQDFEEEGDEVPVETDPMDYNYDTTEQEETTSDED